MSVITRPDEGYYEPLAEQTMLCGDKYGITMALSLFLNGKHEIPTTFHAYIRDCPFDGAYLVTAGQNIFFEWLKNWKFTDRDLNWLRKQLTNDEMTNEQTAQVEDFLTMLKESGLQLTVDAMPEGEVAFPDEPIARIHGPAWQCLVVEAMLLNVINSQSLFATLASRLVEVADGADIFAFGLRRGQAIGGLEAARGTYVGGCAGTSNMQAAEFYDIPCVGTMAHALVMMYEDELDAFKDYIGALPHNGIFLVDTYNTLEGVKNAIKACQEKGLTLKGIRLDSGDLAYLSNEARKLLDAAGFTNAKITASNDLDENEILRLKSEGCKIDVWGVGTHLETSSAQPALGAVYKLGAIFDKNLSFEEIEATRKLVKEGRSPLEKGFTRDVIKLSQDAIKTTIPGELDVVRYVQTDKDGNWMQYESDTIISNLVEDPVGPDGKLTRDVVSVMKADDTQSRCFHKGTVAYHPISRTFEMGQQVGAIETIHPARQRWARTKNMLHRSVLRSKRVKGRENQAYAYKVGIEESLSDHRKGMIRRLHQTHFGPGAPALTA